MKKIIAISLVVAAVVPLSWYAYQGWQSERKQVMSVADKPLQVVASVAAENATTKGKVVLFRALRDSAELYLLAPQTSYQSMRALARDLTKIADRVEDADLPDCLALSRTKTLNALKHIKPILAALEEPDSIFMSRETNKASREVTASAYSFPYTTGARSAEKEIDEACAKQ